MPALCASISAARPPAPDVEPALSGSISAPIGAWTPEERDAAMPSSGNTNAATRSRCHADHDPTANPPRDLESSAPRRAQGLRPVPGETSAPMLSRGTLRRVLAECSSRAIPTRRSRSPGLARAHPSDPPPMHRRGPEHPSGQPHAAPGQLPRARMLDLWRPTLAHDPG